jgi:hypothetical protein
MTLKDRIKQLEDKIDLLMNNHLSHLDGRMKRQEWLSWGLMVLLIGIAFQSMF